MVVVRFGGCYGNDHLSALGLYIEGIKVGRTQQDPCLSKYTVKEMKIMVKRIERRLN